MKKSSQSQPLKAKDTNAGEGPCEKSLSQDKPDDEFLDLGDPMIAYFAADGDSIVRADVHLP
jgi:hypothetical protein